MAKILIAEDSDMMRKIAKMALEKGGHQVIEAANGAEAVEMAKKELPQVILLDAEMPQMDGWEACRAIKSDAKTSKTKVLMCTGHDLSEEQDKIKEAGADGYITKPYQVQQVLSKVNNLMIIDPSAYASSIPYATNRLNSLPILNCGVLIADPR